jgi:DNA polymerase III delta prime subunit
MAPKINGKTTVFCRMGTGGADVLMEKALLDKAGETGFIAVLLVVILLSAFWLVRWVLSTNNEREKRYIDVIDTQAKGLQDIKEIRGDVKDIKNVLLVGGKRE